MKTKIKYQSVVSNADKAVLQEKSISIRAYLGKKKKELK
jgi:hypothetical protein